MKNVLYGSIILLCITLSVCAIMYTCRSRVVVSYKVNTGEKEVNINISSSSIDDALNDIKDIDILWKQKRLGSVYY